MNFVKFCWIAFRNYWALWVHVRFRVFCCKWQSTSSWICEFHKKFTPNCGTLSFKCGFRTIRSASSIKPVPSHVSASYKAPNTGFIVKVNSIPLSTCSPLYFFLSDQGLAFCWFHSKMPQKLRIHYTMPKAKWIKIVTGTQSMRQGLRQSLTSFYRRNIC